MFPCLRTSTRKRMQKVYKYISDTCPHDHIGACFQGRRISYQSETGRASKPPSHGSLTLQKYIRIIRTSQHFCPRIQWIFYISIEDCSRPNLKEMKGWQLENAGHKKCFPCQVPGWVWKNLYVICWRKITRSVLEKYAESPLSTHPQFKSTPSWKRHLLRFTRPTISGTMHPGCLHLVFTSSNIDKPLEVVEFESGCLSSLARQVWRASWWLATCRCGSFQSDPEYQYALPMAGMSLEMPSKGLEFKSFKWFKW